jgi:hypothetical protein
MTAADYLPDAMVEEAVREREAREALARRDPPPDGVSGAPNGPDDRDAYDFADHAHVADIDDVEIEPKGAGDAKIDTRDRVALKHFELVPFDKIAVGSKAVYLVKGIIPRTGLVTVYGPPKCGKSFWTFDLTMHVALGWPYQGRRVKQGAVVYCALEGAEGFKARVDAFRQAKLIDAPADVPFYLISSPMSLVDDHAALIGAIRGALGKVMPSAVAIDTLNRSLAGSESDDRDMALYIQAADAIRNAFACAVIIIHHCGHEGTRPRGHSSLMGAVDAQISVKRDAMDDIIATVEWMKDGPQGDEIVSRLRLVNVGIDEDGEAITSCVVDEVEGSTAPARKAAGAKLTKGAKIAMSALRDAIDECGEVPPAASHIPTGVKAVKIETWRRSARWRVDAMGVASVIKPRTPFKGGVLSVRFVRPHTSRTCPGQCPFCRFCPGRSRKKRLPTILYFFFLPAGLLKAFPPSKAKKGAACR